MSRLNTGADRNDAPAATTERRPDAQRLFTHEIIRGYLISTIDEMIEACRRAAYSTVISEALDFTCGLFDQSGRHMVAQATGVGMHAGTLVSAMDLILQTYDEFHPGDVVVHNNPYRGGTHQADVVVARPIFYKQEQLVGFSMNRGHWLDIGGMAPGGWAGTAEHVVQEALFIPPAKLYKAGRLDREIKDFILSNVRLPRSNWGDCLAQVASSIVAERRMEALIDRYGLEMVKEGEDRALEYTRQRFLARLETVPEGVWHAEETIEDHGRSPDPRYIRVTVTKEPGRLIADFAGTDPQVPATINTSFINAKAAAMIAAIGMIDPGIPLNSGFLDLIDVRAPEGTLVNPMWPVPMLQGPSDPSNKAMEAVVKALAQAIPERAAAGSYQTGNNTTGSTTDRRTGETTQFYSFGAGGCGATYSKDGNSAAWHICGNCKNESMELWEHRVPLEFQEFSLIDDSAGPGRTRGGLGYRRRMKFLADMVVSAAADRHKIGAWGLEGGMRGQPNRFAVRRNGRDYLFTELFDDVVSPSKFSNLPLPAGDEYIIDSGGGGGFGDPLQRDPELVAKDVQYEYVTAASARKHYGVVLDEEGLVDREATQVLREKLRKARRNAAGDTAERST